MQLCVDMIIARNSHHESYSEERRDEVPTRPGQQRLLTSDVTDQCH
jgi:hypothetical protein